MAKYKRKMSVETRGCYDVGDALRLWRNLIRGNLPRIGTAMPCSDIISVYMELRVTCDVIVPSSSARARALVQVCTRWP